MKTSTILIVLTVLLTKCASVNKMTNNAIYHAIVGQNEMTVYKRLGVPANTVSTSDGGKKLIYEYYGKGMYTTPYKSRVTYSPKKDALGNSEGLIFRGGVNTVTNDPRYIINEKEVSFLNVFLDKQGNCIRFEQNLQKKQLEMLYEQFKKYIPPG
jgi:hypothetical protein